VKIFNFNFFQFYSQFLIFCGLQTFLNKLEYKTDIVISFVSSLISNNRDETRRARPKAFVPSIDSRSLSLSLSHLSFQRKKGALLLLLEPPPQPCSCSDRIRSKSNKRREEKTHSDQIDVRLHQSYASHSLFLSFFLVFIIKSC
jgi:hypothetical protein